MVTAAVEFYGADKIMFATDFPFWDWKDALPIVTDNFAGRDRDAVFGGNACRVLGLGN